MSYDNFTMYMATIPKFKKEETSDSGGKKPGGETPQNVTGSFNLFDLDTLK